MPVSVCVWVCVSVCACERARVVYRTVANTVTPCAQQPKKTNRENVRTKERPKIKQATSACQKKMQTWAARRSVAAKPIPDEQPGNEKT